MDDLKKALTILSEGNNRLTGAEQLIYSQPAKKKTKSESWIKPYMMLVESEMSERVVPGEETPLGVNRLTGKPIEPEAPSTPAPAAQPLSSRYDPEFKGMPAAYIIDIGGQQYKFAGRDKQGPGTGKTVKVPAAAIGIRGLGATQVELGQDGMYYMPGGTNEELNTEDTDLARQQAESFIRFSSGLYDPSSLPKAMTIKPGVTLPIRFNPIANIKDSLANAMAANKLLPPELQVSPGKISQIVGQGGEEELGERSVSQAQARLMAASAHNPAFAKKVGMKQSVAKEFNRADKGKNIKSLPVRKNPVDEGDEI